jgi:hypothetical protein
MPTITKIGQAVLCLAVTAPLSGMMPIPWMCTDDYYTHGFVFKYVFPNPHCYRPSGSCVCSITSANSRAQLGRFLYMWVSLLAARFSFYFAWLLSGILRLHLAWSLVCVSGC